MVRKKVEEGRVAVRNVRRDCHDELRRLQREKEVSEDAQYRGQDELQKVTDGFIQEIERVGEEKEAELLVV